VRSSKKSFLLAITSWTSLTRAYLYLSLVLIVTFLSVGHEKIYGFDERESLDKTWQYTDLRAFDPSEGQIPGYDIIAVYLRSRSKLPVGTLSTTIQKNNNLLRAEIEIFEIRLDVLDMTMRNMADIYIAIDHAPGGSVSLPLNATSDLAWDTLITALASESVTIVDHIGNRRTGLGLQITRDPTLDIITLRFYRNALHSGLINWRIQIFTTSQGSRDVADSTSILSEYASFPSQAQVLFAFWNTFPAYTPAQALRRWSGAHTGPMGGSHGLRSLLQSARNFQTPLALLDLKSPLSLSALDYAGGLNLIQAMAANDLLILPEYEASVNEQMPASNQFTYPILPLVPMVVDINKQYSRAFDLPTSKFLYSDIQPGLAPQYPVLLTHSNYPGGYSNGTLSAIRPLRLANLKVIPIPGDLPNDQATLEGPSLDVRRALIATALASQASNSHDDISLLVLGGDLPDSTWGEPIRARTTLAYIKAHPWIKVLNANDLLTMPTGKVQEIDSSKTLPLTKGLGELQESTTSTLGRAAWQTYLAYTSPLWPWNPKLTALRTNYFSQINILLFASKWEIEPRAYASCDLDPDQDGERECILASELVFSVYEIDDGSLTHLFVRAQSGIHQLLGPSSQLIVGLSDPNSWDISRGEKADPTVIPGVISDLGDNFLVSANTSSLSFKSDLSEINYSLITNGIHISYRASQPTKVTLPIVLDPWERFTPGWGERYQENHISRQFEWSLSSGPKVVITSSAQIQAQTFNETINRMGLSENPNLEYSAGHYLVFPFAVLEIGDDLNISIQVELFPR